MILKGNCDPVWDIYRRELKDDRPLGRMVSSQTGIGGVVRIPRASDYLAKVDLDIGGRLNTPSDPSLGIVRARLRRLRTSAAQIVAKVFSFMSCFFLLVYSMLLKTLTSREKASTLAVGAPKLKVLTSRE